MRFVFTVVLTLICFGISSNVFAQGETVTGITPSPSVTASPRPSVTPTPTASSAPQPTSSILPNPSRAPNASPSVSPIPSVTPTPSLEPTSDPSPTPTDAEESILQEIPDEILEMISDDDVVSGTSFLLYEEPPTPEEIFLSLYQTSVRLWLGGESAWWQSVPQNVRERLDHPICRFAFRSLDGFRTNIFHPTWGQAGRGFARYLTAEYGDGVAFPAGSGRISARELSNLLAQPEAVMPDQQGLTDFFWLWGQFISHDLSLTKPSDQELEEFPVRVPIGDPQYDAEATGTVWLPYMRSSFDADKTPRAQTNFTTSFLDASMLYGVDEYRTNALRTFGDGKLKMTNGKMLPYNKTGLPNVGGDSEYLYLSGDVRVNEHVGIVALHTLFYREHNRLAEELKRRFPRFSEEEIFFFARDLVIAEIQAITYNEFLPLLLGKPLPAYTGYNPELDPGIRNLFATAAFELWYSMMSPEILFADDDGVPVGGSPYDLREIFFRPWLLWYEHDLDFILKGFSMQPAQAIDPFLDDALRNFTFEESGLQPVDLLTVLLQRGRDHGLPSYNAIREFFGLGRIDDFSEISGNIALNETLRFAYQDVDAIDAWVGLLAEDKLPNAPIGETLEKIITDQFLRIREGDRFWYERALRPEIAELVKGNTLADVIRLNTDLTSLSDNVFVLGFSDELLEALDAELLPSQDGFDMIPF